MSKNYTAFYIEGLPGIRRPGKTRLFVTRKGLKILKQQIHWANVHDLKIDYAIVNGQGGIGGAIAGGLIAGDAGAIIGGMSSRKKAEPTITMNYSVNGENQTLRLIVDKAEEVEKAFNKYSPGAKAKVQAQVAAQATAKPKEPLSKRLFRIYFALYIIPYKALRKYLAEKKR